ncbi:IS3 family transposase [Candidatus Microgenomates bacterium]|nr:IS3 family transposase [Candidatus Microgenomates bacterium]
MGTKTNKLTKTKIAEDLGVSRQSLYYKSKQKAKDEQLKGVILGILAIHRSYGYRRVAIALGINKKRVQRLMHKYKIRPYKRRMRWKKRLDLRREPMPYTNLIKGWFPIKAELVYVSDFTYLPYRGQFIYLATVMDLYTREIVGWEVSLRHDSNLVLNALINGLYNSGFRLPSIIHSDQGSEYSSKGYIKFLNYLGIRISMSKKSSPWENAYQESYYSNFKTDLGLEFDRFEGLGEFVEGIHNTLNYYNDERIHTSLKMTPSAFAKLHKSV